MIVMLGSNATVWIGYLAGRFPGKIGHLYSPGDAKGPWPFIPYSLDNGKYAAWQSGATWDESGFIKHVEWGVAQTPKPMWIVVPDSVGNRTETMALWEQWEPRLRTYGLPLAMAVQDGMSPADLPSNVDVVFVGGTFAWKWKSLRGWCDNFPRVHVGRVNYPQRLYECQSLGVESVDGTGWARKGWGNPEIADMIRFLDDKHAIKRVDQQELFNVFEID